MAEKNPFANIDRETNSETQRVIVIKLPKVVEEACDYIVWYFRFMTFMFILSAITGIVGIVISILMAIASTQRHAS